MRRAQIVVDVARQRVRIRASRSTIAGLATYVTRAEGVRNAMLSVTLVGARAMARLNRKHLGHAGSTDVISFGLSPAARGRRLAVVGDIYICPAVARVQARRYGVSLDDELARLVVHGVLHVLGWNHPDGPGRLASPMWSRQEALLARWRRARHRQ